MENDIRKHNLEIVLIEANGYCFLNSVPTCLLWDYGDTLTLDDCITKIVMHLCQNHRKYSAFHQTSCTKYAADQLISDALDFFWNGQFLADVVNLIMQITADALVLELFIYQCNANLTQVLWFKHPDSDRIVRVKFTSNNLYPGGNHYDAIVCILEPQMNLILISDVASKMAKIPSKDETNNIIDLTLSDEEDTKISQSSCTFDEVEEELESSGQELKMHIEDKSSSISAAYLQMPPLNKYLKPDPGQETSYSGSTESYSHSDETYVSTDLTDPEPNSSPASTPASTPKLQRKNPFPRRTSNRHRTPRKILSSSGTSSSTSDAQYDPNDEDLYMAGQFEAKVLTSQISHGRPFPTWYFERTVPELIDAIPLDIDGTQLFWIKTTRNEWTKVTCDLRHFQMVTSSREDFKGERRIGTCLGSFVCHNEQCSFIRTSRDF